MILRLALRSLATRPLRTAVLAVGFGLGIAVMAALLGVGEVILEQAHSPALQGGGDLVLSSGVGPIESARFVLSDVLQSARFAPRIAAASPARRATLYLITNGTGQAVAVHGGVPSLERAVGDPEIESQPSWLDAPDDEGWKHPPAGEVLRAMDRFHHVPEHVDPAMRPSWAEWLYFNGRTADGRSRFYLTFLSGGPVPATPGERPVFVRLQIDRDGKTTNYSAASTVDDAELLAHAPDIDVGGNRVRLESGKYHITLAFGTEHGDLWLDPAPGRSVPPNAIHGARGWLSGYVVPVLSGTLRGAIGDLSLDGASGYHDHNWGFWQGVRWQWGQVTGPDVSIIYGRVFPPADVADADRIPGFLGVLGSDGPIAFSTDVSIAEHDEGGSVKSITVRAQNRQMDLVLDIDVAEATQTRTPLTRGPAGSMNFLQLSGVYNVSGNAAGRELHFSARGSAETFRP
jgi:hypothetical protein